MVAIRSDGAPPRLGESVVVISPHLDDAALSLGATISATAAGGSRVTVLTVLAGDPGSSLPAEDWDASAGFETLGEAARARRVEDTRACAILGARPVWFPYNDDQYERGADDATIHTAIVEALSGTDAMLLPGYPLTHPDHAWLARLALLADLPCERVGLYVEQPYTWLTTGSPVAVAGAIADLVPAELGWERARHRARDTAAKLRACLAYRSQLPLLGRRRILRAIASDLKRGGEAIAWLPR